MRLIKTLLLFLVFSVNLQASEAEFNAKLKKMYYRINKSVDILREQITNNQSAPYLANLYMELGTLLSQKANVLYYLKMEQLKGEKSEGDEGSKQFSDVVVVTKESIAVYGKITKEFPKFAGLPRAYYAMALAQRSIDERVPFMKTARLIISKYPTTQEAVKSRLLLGQFQFDGGVYDEALKSLGPVAFSKFPYERNAAKYKMGLIKLAEGKHKAALSLFRQVVIDKELKPEENEKELSLDSKDVKSSLKREALIDSVRAYTHVFKKNAKPISYYSEIAPTENLFQEVIEKLAYRYIHQKKYNDAVKLLRTLSERNSNPEKVLNIYKEVLLMIPLDKRVDVPVAEIEFVISRFLQFSNFYRLKDSVKKSTYDFFEKQLRDLATRSHERGKKSRGIIKDDYFEKAASFYNLYFATFKRNKHSVKLAMNMGDTHYRLKNYLKSGDYYIRVFKGEFGKTAQRGDSIKNAIYALQKNKDYTFYETRRVNGLLIEALKSYMNFDSSKRKDPKTNYSLAKAYYDQGFYQSALPKLYGYIKKFPKAKYSADAADLILDYYNVKSDFKGIIRASNKILSMKIPNAALNSKVSQIRDQAKLQKLQKIVHNNASGGSTGESYLKHAANLSSDLRNIALKKALESSKAEKDFKTFLKTASLMANQEKDSEKKNEIQSSIAQEHLKMTNFNASFDKYMSLARSGSKESRLNAFKQAVSIAIAMKDINKISKLGRSASLMSKLDSDYKSQLENQIASILESPVRIPSGLSNVVKSLGQSPSLALGLFKATPRLNQSLKSYSKLLTKRVCSGGSGVVCNWKRLQSIDGQAKSFNSRLAKANASADSIEQYAGGFSELAAKYSEVEGGSDPQLGMVSSLRQFKLYNSFADYLGRVAKKNPSLSAVLKEKITESRVNAKSFLKRCREIIATSNLDTPTNKYCKTGQQKSFSSIAFWARGKSSRSMASAPESSFPEIKRNLFASFKPEDLMDISYKYYKKGAFNYASAAATYALSLGGADTKSLNTIIGCSAKKLNLLNEARYFLKSGSSVNGLRNQCLRGL